jgi:hypothetical protein
MDRVFYRHPGTTDAVTLNSIWPNNNGPFVFKAISLATKLAQTWGVQSLLRRTFDDRASVWRELDERAAI